MELLVIFLIFIIPIVVGFCSGFSTNTMTINRSRSDMNQELEISDESTSLTQQLPESDNDQTLLPEISSLSPEVERSLSQLLKELADEQDKSSLQEGQIKEESESEQFLAPLSDSDIPLTLGNQSNEEAYEAPTIKLPADEYNAIGRFYGYDFADQVTTTPALGPTLNEVDIMMGRLIYLTDGGCELTYNRKSISLRGESISREMDGEVVMVKGFFLESELFFVQETDRIERSKEELDLQYGS
ncbi:hypothetical protein IAQ67_14435 [Paenibacillus peoriae]|uniref:Uncharacterized protein n=1 Tax=Paenibacillus peoriae TaxID=59893 RepID=A0A7H0Y209_9BACL|nr:hypothetical protein [Paenibacillus peoriae]QNR65117.1 hypothetical protein IAQ67_14435 [Paenibacillus peoriae]